MSPRNRGLNAATLLPLALGLAPAAPELVARGRAAAPPAAAVADASAISAGSLIARTQAIPRLDLDAPEPDILDSWEKPTPNKSRLGDCGWYGSEGADRETNQRKNRTDLPSRYRAVTFDAIADLGWPQEATTRRDKWKPAQLAEIRPYEGVALTVTGFVAAFTPQARNAEATNCKRKGEDETDWHIGLVGEFGDPPSEAVVVETTPRIKQKHPAWKPSRIKALVGKADSLRVSGYLLMDPVHKGHLGRHRQTLWEIHPIHRIEVFERGRWHDIDDDPSPP